MKRYIYKAGIFSLVMFALPLLAYGQITVDPDCGPGCFYIQGIGCQCNTLDSTTVPEIPMAAIPLLLGSGMGILVWFRSKLSFRRSSRPEF